jgi:hypothetical protein
MENSWDLAEVRGFLLWTTVDDFLKTIRSVSRDVDRCQYADYNQFLSVTAGVIGCAGMSLEAASIAQHC